MLLSNTNNYSLADLKIAIKKLRSSSNQQSLSCFFLKAFNKKHCFKTLTGEVKLN